MPSGFAAPRTFLGKGEIRPNLVSNWRYLTSWLNGFRSEVTTDINSGYRFGGYVYFTSSGTFDKANYPGLRAVLVECQGGGGAGGGRSASSSVGAGGGGGGYARALVTEPSLGTSETVTVGAGGTGVSGAAGNAGGNTTFGSLCQGTGGGGGAFSQTTDVTVSGGGGGGGIGDLVIAGGNGRDARLDTTLYSATLSDVESGHGGDSFLGHGGTAAAAGQTGVKDNGRGYGGGGSGIAGAGAAGGANGAPGIVIVTLYF